MNALVRRSDIPLVLLLLLGSCGQAGGGDEEVVDTSLNDPVPEQTVESNVQGTADAAATTLTQDEARPKVRNSASQDEEEQYEGEEAVEQFEPTRAKAPFLAGLFTADDYPADAQRNNEQGRVTVELLIGTDGRVAGCTVASSSGSRSLDSATCRILRGRARFTPARDSSGMAVQDTLSTTIGWRLEG